MAASTEPRLCPTCGKGFVPRRKDARFCRPLCQQKSSRGPRTIKDSHAERDRNRRHYSRARELADDLYSLPPGQRLGYMRELIAAAREGNTDLRAILTDKAVMCGSSRYTPKGRLTIAQAADRYCRAFWGHDVKAVVYGKAPEPPTGEIECFPDTIVGEASALIEDCYLFNLIEQGYPTSPMTLH